MAYIQEKVKGSERSFPIIFCQLNDKLEFVGPLERVIANQCARWCGNLHRIPSSLSSYMPFFCTVFRNSSMRSSTSIQGIATPVCALARNDRKFGFGMTTLFGVRAPLQIPICPALTLKSSIFFERKYKKWIPILWE